MLNKSNHIANYWDVLWNKKTFIKTLFLLLTCLHFYSNDLSYFLHCLLQRLIAQ